MPENFLLEMKNIKKSFSGVRVLHGIDFYLKSGKIMGLVGENGAGKSTLMNVLGGVIPYDDGLIEIEGQSFYPKSPNDSVAAGISFIHQELSLFTNLTIAENIFIEDFPKDSLHGIKYKEIRNIARKYIDEFKINASPNTKIKDVPMGIRQIIEICKALEKDSKIIIFDEPTTSLSQKEKEILFKMICQLQARGITIVYISHILEEVFELCDDIAVLRNGHIIGIKEKTMLDKMSVIRMMVGRDVEKLNFVDEKDIGNVVFHAKDVIRIGTNETVSLQLKKGEIVGLFGLMGAGRTELARGLFGVDPITSGEVIVQGKKMKKITPKNCIDNRIAFITENRSEEGLILSKPIKDNIVLVVLSKILKRFGIVKTGKEKEIVENYINTLSIKVNDPINQKASSLSGGNQQKVVVSKWLTVDPKIMILDEPTRGIDVGAKFEIYTLINKLAEKGTAVLFISSEMEELIGICDRILIMHRSKLVAEIDRKSFSKETLMRYAAEGGEN